MARTQQQRREDTIARLLDASIDTIIEVGYARDLGGRDHQAGAGIRRRPLPALPHHGRLHGRDGTRGGATPTRGGREAGRRDPGRQAGSRGGADDHPRHHRQPHQHRDVRADRWPRAPTRSCGTHCERSWRCTSRRSTKPRGRCPPPTRLDAFGEENFAALVAVLINTFDGAAMVRHVLAQPEIEERRIPVLMSLLTSDDGASG